MEIVASQPPELLPWVFNEGVYVETTTNTCWTWLCCHQLGRKPQPAACEVGLFAPLSFRSCYDANRQRHVHNCFMDRSA